VHSCSYGVSLSIYAIFPSTSNCLIPFVCRYKADLSTRDSRLSELQEKWFKTQLQGSPAATGPTGRVPAAPLTAEQRDMQQALQWFRKLGWDVQEAEGESRGQDGVTVHWCTVALRVAAHVAGR
jgi:hypothetical protein